MKVHFINQQSEAPMKTECGLRIIFGKLEITDDEREVTCVNCKRILAYYRRKELRNAPWYSKVYNWLVYG